MQPWRRVFRWRSLFRPRSSLVGRLPPVIQDRVEVVSYAEILLEWLQSRAMTILNGSPVVTRFAPSPTGALHLGNARTALFSYLWARKTGGRFILRIEDTDAERSQLRFRDELLAQLRWLGLDWDEGPDVGGPSAPYSQAERGDFYRTLYSRLESEAQAYPCYCTPAELELSRK